ncbi:histidine kinase [Nocardioides zeae]|uniref:histidine kinase n=1 Tax=Nocardioides imazamoxiresistens TaxID=3231893 RepID=A0ABU3Q0P6_9ACTN|nr:histidine kinase [Nocardioides zeae]MDT9595087.1 histidine kinase [Nocardioides zeae]
MRRIAAEEWSALAMLVICLAAPLPVLLGDFPTTVPRGVWALAFAVGLCALVVAAVAGVPRRRRRAYALATVLAAALVLTAPGAGWLPILLVLVAAVGPYTVPRGWNAAVVAVNTGVVVAATLQVSDSVVNVAANGAFYLMIQVASVLSVAAILREQQLRAALSEAHVGLQAQSVLLAETSRAGERLRISRDLHDLIGHQLTVLVLELEAARHRGPGAAGQHVERADAVARALLADVRSTVGELREAPVDLVAALSEVGRAAPGLLVGVEVEPAVAVDAEQAAAMVRAMQEIVTNCLRHARADRLDVVVRRVDGQVLLTAGDDGWGGEAVAGNGLRGLAERFADLGGGARFDGADGFRVEAWVPAR